ncbi:GIY-YIG nuclease family protein [Agarivorans sp. 1_MG-2023]|uniref:GIY-YIG nuclease family protein n=1 Tax=Agarivorans sp. 1_MG-2023 TaxID=3062634 RepID=UPI0026E2706A|nr:GIY-YIG nuclease family protein [Agarivorans sp. 1_MG-2023]MDO6765908.1 GIY-YIG nuclease family protein [Agarivorans sp. 1_MG-2023]
MEELRKLSPVQDQVVNKAIENINRKLIAGYRNRSRTPTSGQQPGIKSTFKNTIKAASAKDAIEVAQRGSVWKEVISKSFSHGILSLASLKFDSEFTVKNGQAEGLASTTDKPGVYVVYDKQGNVRYIGDAVNVKKRWQAGHLNENKQKEKNGEKYKLQAEFDEGCTVKVIECESPEAAAALEASLIQEARSSEDYDVVNAKEELLNQQGSRSNIEAKKVKDSLESRAELAMGAGKEALKNGGWSMVEKAITESIQAFKDELVDFFLSGEHMFIERLKRLLKKIFQILKNQLTNISEMLKGVFEFVVNAFSKAISQMYQLAKNLYDLGSAAWDLYKNRNTMTKEQLIEKATQTIVLSANTVFWGSMDLVFEAQLTPIAGPMAPFIAAIISAMGFGITGHYLNEFVPKIVDFIVGGYTETKQHLQESATQLIESSRMNIQMVNSLESYVQSSVLLVTEVESHTERLTTVSSRKIAVREDIEF